MRGPQFAHELLRDQDQIACRLDSRFSSAAVDPLGEFAEYDPMNSYIESAFATLPRAGSREVNPSTVAQDINAVWYIRNKH